MKPIYPAIIILGAVTVAGIFYKSIYLDILSGFFVVIAFLFLLADERKQKRTMEVINKSFMGKRESEKEKEGLSKELAYAKEKISDIENKAEGTSNDIETLYRLITEFDLSVPIIKKLGTVITQKSEESTLSVGEKIFQIVSESQKVSSDIQILLLDISTGDHSLENELDHLLSEVEDFKVIVGDVEKLKESYLGDMERIRGTVEKIKDLSKTIADIADQTNILGVNSSIEASRAGKAGEGFAVIAGETQKLAFKSKRITDEITTSIKEIDTTMIHSFQRQSKTLTTTVEHLKGTKDRFSQMTFNLGPKIKNIALSIAQSKTMSETVTSRLNDITMSLQYQDATRQILEHIIQLLEIIQKRFNTINLDMYQLPKEEQEKIKRNILENAEKLFTVREEWLSVGLKLDESDMSKELSKEGSNSAGDIELF